MRPPGSDADPGGMRNELPHECLRLLKEQDGVITARQAVRAGLPAGAVRDLVRAERWQVLYRGVYSAYTGPPARMAQLWAVALRAGPEAVLSHRTAADLWGLVNAPGPIIHVSVPHDSNPERRGQISGVIVHRSRSLPRARHPVLSPPRTRVEDTVLDLIDSARTFDEAYDWICRAVGRRRTTAAHIHAALDSRPRMQRRMDVELALGYARGGVLSVLELRYVRGVEGAHGLPLATRQARVRQVSGNRYLDNFYPGYDACVEIDGTAAHPQDEQWRDKNRDRWNAVHLGIGTIRIGVPDLTSKEQQCRTAADVARWLSGRGPRVGRPCGPHCPVRLSGVHTATYTRYVHPVLLVRDAWGAGDAVAGWGWCGGDRWSGCERPSWGGAVAGGARGRRRLARPCGGATVPHSRRAPCSR
jgi:hypothetical protein